ncbi:MAG: HAD-IC family P-type ATPase, partial [Candidatus Binatia bacterium]|nr:HAD-IC family P-type ATPase [Candidatus Binatia bacterium]
MVQAIHTAVPGRARYKVDGLYRSEALKHYLEARLASYAGIHQVTANPATGNILVSFSPANSAATVASLIATVLAEFSSRNGPHENSNSTTAPHPAAGGDGLFSSGLVPQKDAAVYRKELATPVTARPDGHGRQPWHLYEGAAVLAALQTSRTEGLSQAAAAERLRQYGPNVLPETAVRSDWDILLDQCNSLPVALLGAAAGVALLTGGLVDALVILGVVAINATIGYITESQSERTLQSLKNLVRPTALVLREGQPVEVSADTVVVGDLLVLKPGSYVAADARLIETQHLSVDESSLTGESLPVLKTAEPLMGDTLPLADRVNMVYRGTLVTGGQGLAVVVATGRETEIGQIQLLAGEARAPETPMERQLRHLGTQLVFLGSAVCGAVFAIGLLRGYGFLPMLQAAIALAVAAVPEGLPTVATTTLALGVRTMRRHRVLIRSLDAVEALGCVQTVCLDKTGTLTLNRMSVVALYAGMHRIRLTEGRFVVGETPIDPSARTELARLVQICVLCSETEIARQGDQYVLRGSPTENALIHAAIQAGVDVLQLREQFPTVRVDLRAENRNFVRTLHRSISAGAGTLAAPFLVAVKGSPAEVLAMCRWHLVEG